MIIFSVKSVSSLKSDLFQASEQKEINMTFILDNKESPSLWNKSILKLTFFQSKQWQT